VQPFDDWVPFADPWAIAVLDRTVPELVAAYGWSFAEVDEVGLGPMFYLPLGWDGERRFLLTASGAYPEDGVAVEVSKSEDATAARGDLLAELGLDRKALVAISEEGVWFARWDQPSAGQRPASAAPRDARSQR
jgi:hypothetical protein